MKKNFFFVFFSKLNALVKGWMEQVCVKRNMNPESVSRCKIYTFGSYRLGVHSKYSDTDVLCVVPRHINRTDCFTSFYRHLKSQPEIKELRVRPIYGFLQVSTNDKY